ncbi:MAG: methylated-DNA--[protein]-cysteine S-methyltransferase [Acidimicrobiia bacterium]|nr:methylated-DNA--[protein]-cysteine S-methyltransferase [Acidimicrobiia bacterium]
MSYAPIEALARELADLANRVDPAVADAVGDRALDAVGLADEAWQLPSPLGSVWVARSRRGVSYLCPHELDEFTSEFRARTGRPLRVRAAGEADPVLRQAVAGADGRGLEVDLRAVTGFQREVLEAVREIPAGEVRAYAEVAELVGRPRAVRAVGTALARNPVPLLVPCHRVVRTDGSVGQYALGPAAKVALLRVEGVAVP